MAESIEIMCVGERGGVLTHMGPRNRVLDGDPYPSYVKVKVKVRFFYSTTYSNAATSRAVQSYEVAVDWQEPVVLPRKLRPSIARVNVQLDPRHAASKHTTAPINHTRPSPRKLSPDGAGRARKQTSDYSLLLSLSTTKG